MRRAIGPAQCPAAAIRGGAIKRGVCSIAIRTGVPIVPCVMLGTHALNRVKPWLPFKHATIWVAYGEAIFPEATTSTRAARHALADRIVQAYQALYAELRQTYNITDDFTP